MSLWCSWSNRREGTLTEEGAYALWGQSGLPGPDRGVTGREWHQRSGSQGGGPIAGVRS